MELNYQQITAIALGAVHTEQKPEGLFLYRFTPEEMRLYENRSLYTKLYVPAGIRLEFETDATGLEMTVTATLPRTTRSYFRVDILKDGKMLGGIQNYPEQVENGTYPATEFPLGSYSGSFALGEGMKKITVQLPWSLACAISRLALPGATILNPLKREKKALIYGDSITQGYDALSPSNAYSVRLCDYWGAEGINKAIGGECYCPDLAAIPCGFQPDYILGAYGTNDWHQLTPEVFEDRCLRFWSNICANYPGVKKYAITPIWFQPNRDGNYGPFETFPEIEKTIRRFTSQFPDITLIYGWDLVPHDLTLFGDARLHPNDEGFDHYFNNLIRAIPL